MIKTNFFFEWYENGKIKTTKKMRFHWKLIFWTLFLIIFIWSFSDLYSPLNSHGWLIFQENFKQIFAFAQNPKYPSFNLWKLSWILILKTLQYTIAGTFFGFLLAFWTAYFSSTLHSKIFALPWKITLAIFKALPILFFFFAIESAFQKDLAATIIIFWFSWLWVHKYILDIINSTTLTAYYIAIKKGNSKFSAFWKEIIPRINNKMFGLFLYSLESNITWTTLLSSVGLIGIGQLIYQTYIDPTVGLKSLATPLLSLLIVILFFEILIFCFNFFILKQKSKKTLKNPDITFKKITKICFGLFLIILVFQFFLTLEWNFSQFQNIIPYLKQMFQPSWYLFSKNNFDENPLLMLLSLLQQSFLTIIFITVFGLLQGIFFNEKINHPILSWTMKIFTTSIRVVPSIVFIFLFAPIVSSPHYLLICFIIAFNSSTIVAKQTSEAINRINFSTYDFLVKTGWNKYKIIKDFVFPSIQKEFWSIVWFRYENCLRSLVFLGLYGGTIIGTKIKIYTDISSPSYNINSFAAIIWTLFFLFLFIELVSWINWKKLKKCFF